MRRQNHSLRWLVALGAFFAGSMLSSAQTSSPLLLITLRHQNKLVMVDPASRKVVGSVPVGNDPHGVAASADGKTAFVANLTGSSISVIDVLARKELRRVAVPGSLPHDIQVAGGKAYFTADGYKSVGRYDPATNELDFFGVGQNSPHMLAISKDATRLFSANRYSRSISVIEGFLKGPRERTVRDNWTVTVIPVGQEGEGIDVTPDGKEVWTGNRDGSGVSIIDLATKKATGMDLQIKDASRLKISPDGRLALVADNESDVTVVIDAQTRKVIKRVNVKSGFPLVTPDSSRAYMAGGGDYVAILDLKTLEPAGQIDCGNDPHALAWADLK